MNPPSLTVSWKVDGLQENLLTCLAISPKGTRLLVASEGRDLILVNVQDGHVLVKLCFEKQFSVLAALWYSESNAICGCSNGSLYDLCFEPANRDYPATMSPFLNPFSHQIRSLAFDPTRHLLAIGYGNTVALFMYENPDRQYLHSEWKPQEIIKGPSNSESGLVHALLFYPTGRGTRNLLIGYSELGWNVWSDISSVKRISPELNHNVCRIGRAVLAADEKSLAVSTLDRTIAIYALGDDGPILSSMKEFPYTDTTDFSPIVPIASTPGGLTLGGTACGELPVIENAQGEMSLMRHEEGNHIIRAIVTHEDKIIVGSSCWTGSTVKCYSSSAVVNGKKHAATPQSVTVTEALAGWESSDSRWLVTGETKKDRKRTPISGSTCVWVTLAAMIVVLILSADPPSGPSFEAAKTESYHTDVLKPKLKRHEYWLLFGVRHFCKYFVFQCSAWLAWIVGVARNFLGGIAKIVPAAADVVTIGTAKWVCERVQVYKDLGVCPKIEY